MPILGGKPRDCFNAFAHHLGPLLTATVSGTRQVRVLVNSRQETRATVRFTEPGGNAIPVETTYGKLFVSFAQDLEAVKEVLRYRLRTLRYGYRVQAGASATEQALIRWEYENATTRDSHCRHHVQIPALIGMPARQLDLDKAHVPTGWVTIEEVIRFLVVDLGHKPPCGDEWWQRLQESERQFYEEFTGKRYKPPHD